MVRRWHSQHQWLGASAGGTTRRLEGFAMLPWAQAKLLALLTQGALERIGLGRRAG